MKSIKELPRSVKVIVALSPVVGTAVGYSVTQLFAVEDRNFAFLKEQLSIEREATELWRNRYYDTQDHNYRLTEEVVKLRLEHATEGTPAIEVVRSVIARDPGISWVKLRVDSGEFVMVEVSPGFARTFLGGPPALYRGKRDREIWPDRIAAGYAENDERVYREAQGSRVREEVAGGPLEQTGIFQGRKWHLRLQTGEDLIFGSGAFIVDESE